MWPCWLSFFFQLTFLPLHLLWQSTSSIFWWTAATFFTNTMNNEGLETCHVDMSWAPDFDGEVVLSMARQGMDNEDNNGGSRCRCVSSSRYIFFFFHCSSLITVIFTGMTTLALPPFHHVTQEPPLPYHCKPPPTHYHAAVPMKGAWDVFVTCLEPLVCVFFFLCFIDSNLWFLF